MKEYVVLVHDEIKVCLNPDNYATREDLRAAIIHEAEVKAGRGFDGKAVIANDPTFLGE